MRSKYVLIGNRRVHYVTEVELTFQCPYCLAMETLFLEDGLLTEAGHWKQVKGKVYHRNCARPAKIIDMSRRNICIPSNTSALLMNILEQRQETVGQLATGACLELAVKYQGVRKKIPRHSH